MTFNKDYLQRLQEVVKALDEQKIPTVAVRGYGKDEKEAKIPLNFNIKERFGTWENFKHKIHEQNQNTLELLQSGKAKAIGVIGFPHFQIVDIDFYRIDDQDIRNKILDAIEYLKEVTYVEKTPRGGYHIFFKTGEKVSNVRATKGFVDIKYLGYVITAPSCLFIQNNVLRYETISKLQIENLSEVDAVIEDYIDLLQDIINIVRSYTSKRQKQSSLSSQTYDKKFKWHVASRVKQLFSKITDTSLLKYFLYIYAQLVLDCKGFAEAIRHWIVEKVIPIKKVEAPLSIPRGTHFLVENDIFGLLWNLGVKYEVLEKLAEELDYIDGVEGSPPVHTLKYTIIKNNYVVPCGFCPFMLLGKCACTSTVLRKALAMDPGGWKARRLMLILLKHVNQNRNRSRKTGRR